MKQFSLSTAQFGDVYINPNLLNTLAIRWVYLDYNETLIIVANEVMISHNNIAEWLVFSHNIKDELLKLITNKEEVA